MTDDRPKIGCALGGGAARGLAHIGVLTVLERRGRPPAAISGTSIGAIIGALYAIEPDANYVYRKVLDLLSGDLFRQISLGFLKKQAKQERGFFAGVGSLWKKGRFFMTSFIDRGYIPSDRFTAAIDSLLPDIDISQTTLPLAVVATNITSSCETVFTKGSLRHAVAASSAIPGVIEPIEIDGAEYVDGGWANNVPVGTLATLGADVRIGVNVTEDWGTPQELATGLEIFNRANLVSREILNRILMREADILVTPRTNDLHWTEYSRCTEIIGRGVEAMEAQWGSIEQIEREWGKKEDPTTNPPATDAQHPGR